MHQREHVACSVSRLLSWWCLGLLAQHACGAVFPLVFVRLGAETTEELVFPDCFKFLSGRKQQESQISCCFSPVLAPTAFKNSV